ncbi:MAG: hypothetical protein LUO93_09635 [Methanomicrobiales archaeon]|nr:hypothetical protein [Methanomicrobiales archaeon]
MPLTLESSSSVSCCSRGPVMALAMTPAGDYVVVGCADGRINLLDGRGRLLINYQVPGDVSSVAISDHGTAIAAGTSEGQIYFFSAPEAFPVITAPVTTRVPTTTVIPNNTTEYHRCARFPHLWWRGCVQVWNRSLLHPMVPEHVSRRI